MKISEIFLGLLFIATGSFAVYTVREHRIETESRAYIQEHHVIITNKEKRRYGAWGGREEYYFLYSDGKLEEVSFSAYMKYNIGDRITYKTKEYRE
jgi:hypothetical protein